MENTSHAPLETQWAAAKILALDWAYKSDKTVFYNGEKTISKPKLEGINIVVCENIPRKYGKEFLEKKIKVLRIHQNRISKFREENGTPKTDEGDAKLIYEYYKLHPEEFKEWVGDAKIKILYETFKELQKVRVATSNRLWSNTDDFNKNVFKDMEKIENNILKEIKKELENYKIWTDWLSGIKGIGTATAGGLIAYIKDIKNFDQISALWHYFGLHVVNGKAPKLQRGTTGTFNTRGRSLVIGIIGDMFIKQRTPLYREIYDKEKSRQLGIEYTEGELFEKFKGYKKSDIHVTLGHAHNRAIRKMIKMFLSHLWQRWRELEGLPVTEPYSIAILKHKHKIEPCCS